MKYNKHTAHVAIMLYNQTNFTCHQYAKHQTVHVTIMLYQQTHSTCRHYSIPRNTLYTSPRFYTTKQIVDINIMP